MRGCYWTTWVSFEVSWSWICFWWGCSCAWRLEIEVFWRRLLVSTWGWLWEWFLVICRCPGWEVDCIFWDRVYTWIGFVDRWRVVLVRILLERWMLFWVGFFFFGWALFTSWVLVTLFSGINYEPTSWWFRFRFWRAVRLKNFLFWCRWRWSSGCHCSWGVGCHDLMLFVPTVLGGLLIEYC